MHYPSARNVYENDVFTLQHNAHFRNQGAFPYQRVYQASSGLVSMLASKAQLGFAALSPLRCSELSCARF